MFTYKTLMLATDFSEGSAKAAQHAASLAQLCQARLHVVHVITELSDKRRRRLPAAVVETFVREIETHALEDMNHFVEQHFADAGQQGYQVTSDVVLGADYHAILEEATKVGADLLVMGTHGRTGIEKVLVGSTAERIVRNASIPVLTVRS